MGIFGCPKKDRAVMTELASVAPDNLKKEEDTRSVEQRQRLSSRTINFTVAAVRTGLQSNSAQ
jgi:hypothetical protein